MWASGIITADTLYWNDSEQGWKPVTELFAVKSEPSPHPPIEHKSTESTEAAKVVPPTHEQKRPEAPDIGKADETSENSARTNPSDMGAWNSAKPHPWRRLWAKFIDLQILGGIPASIFAPILYYFFPQIPLSNYCLAFYFAFATGLEAWFLTKFGTTPAKYLLGISVTESNGENLTLSHAGQRTRSAFIRTIPLVLLFSGPLAYRDLKTKGATKWDQKNGFLVTYSRIGASRWFFAITVCVVFILSSAIGIFEIFQYAARMDKEHSQFIIPSFSLNTAVLPASSASVSNDPDYKAARVAEDAHDNNAMLKHAKILIGRYPNSTLALKCLSDAFFYTDSQQEALIAINKAIQIDPKDIVAWHDLGNIRSAMKQLPEAEDAFKQGLKLKPNEPLLLADLGGVQIDLGQKENALRSTEQAQQSMSSLPFDSHDGELREEWVWSGIADNYRDLEQGPKAIIALNNATKINPHDAELWSRMADLYSRADQTKEALEAYEQVARINPKDEDVWRLLGGLFTKQARLGDAVTAYEHNRDLNSGMSSWGLLAIAYADNGRLQDAVNAFKTSLNFPGTNTALAETWFALGGTYELQGKAAEAADAYAQAEKNEPGIVQRYKTTSQTSTPSSQSSSGLHPQAQSKSNAQRELDRQITALMVSNAANSTREASSASANPPTQSSSGLHPKVQSKSNVQREFARQITPLMFPESEDGNTPLGKAITREIARLRAAENGELYTEDAPLSITGRMADSLGIKPLMTVDAASSIVFARWKMIRTDAQPPAQSSSGAQKHDQSKFDVQREFATQVSILMFPDGPNVNTPLSDAVTREIARLRAAESGELYTEDAPLSITGRMADSLGIRPAMTVDEASSIVLTQWQKIRTEAASNTPVPKRTPAMLEEREAEAKAEKEKQRLSNERNKANAADRRAQLDAERRAAARAPVIIIQPRY